MSKRILILFLNISIIGAGAKLSSGQVFTRITEGIVVGDSSESHGCSWGDYDNDEDVDIFISNYQHANLLYQNNGDGSFTQITTGDIVNDYGSSYGSSWGDYNNDGYVDLFVANLNAQNLLYINNKDGNFTKIINEDVFNDVRQSRNASWADYNQDGYLDLFVANGFGNNNVLYKNNGDGSFTKITVGTIVNDGGNSAGCSWADYDNDGDPDLFVANTSDENNFLYRNNGDGTFTKITDGAIVNTGGYSQGSSWGDYNNDGNLDLFVPNAYSSNILYRNNGNGTFSKITTGDIVTDEGIASGSSWADYDNDGNLDLFVSNREHQNNFLYKNNGDGTFTKITTGDIVTDTTSCRANSWCDYDNDGDSDLFVTNRFGNNLLYMNNGNANNWLNIKCVGTTSNTAAIGTKVRIKATITGRSIWQMREISGQTGYCGQNSLNAEFGLGDATTIDSIKVEWPSGIIDVFTRVVANQFIKITEGLANFQVNYHHSPDKFELSQNFPNPFNMQTTIRYNVPEASRITLNIYNVRGQKIKTLLNDESPAGYHRITWDGRDSFGEHVTSGIYIYALTAEPSNGPSIIKTQKMTLLK